MDKILEIKDLSHKFQDGAEVRELLKNINYEFEKGKLYSILGYSGSGKTTLVSFLSGLDTPTQGSISYDGKDLTEIRLDKYRRNKATIVFQEYNLVDYLTAHQNVVLAMDITENEVPDDKEEVAFNLLDYVGIVNSKAKRKVKNLSGGEKQRVAVARAIATNADLIFADEPTGNLDTETEVEIISIFKELAVKHDKCVIIVTHSNEVAKNADIILRLNNGQLNEVDNI